MVAACRGRNCPDTQLWLDAPIIVVSAPNRWAVDPFKSEHLPITAFNQDLDAAWIVHLEQDKGNGAKTIHNKHGFLSAGLNAAVAERPCAPRGAVILSGGERPSPLS